MRTLLLSVFTAFVLVFGYTIYWYTKGDDGVRVAKRQRASTQMSLATRQTNKPYGPGKKVWIVKHDPETGEIISRYKGDEYRPRNDGWVEVTNPKAQFFLKDGRVIAIEGTQGEMILEDAGQKTGVKALAGSRDAPNRGRMKNVIIRIFHTKEDPEAEMDDIRIAALPEKERPRAAMTIELPNASFDNQTMKIFSERYQRDKRHWVEADWVPVKLRGDDYDFDGFGLVIRWNQRDQRLMQLRVEHGQKLIVKKPGKVLKNRDEGLLGMEPGTPLPVMLAAKGKAGAAEAIAAASTQPTTRRVRPAAGIPKPKIRVNTDPPLYRAIFHENVRVTQGAELNVSVNKLSIDFLMEDEDGKSPQTKPTTGPATQASTASSTLPAARTARRVRRPATTQSAPENPQTPIVITWSGPLVVEPLVVGTENALAAGEAVVRLEGAPVSATQHDSTILCGTLTYRTQDQMMVLMPQSPDVPVVMKDTKGTLIHTTRMDYSQGKRQAVLHGASSAVFPQEDDRGKPGEPMRARWAKTCTLYFARGAKGAESSDLNIEKAELDGDVTVDHPQLKLKSQALELGFQPSTRPSTRPATTAATNPAPLANATRDLAELDRRIGTLAEGLGKGESLDQKSEAIAKTEEQLAGVSADIKKLADAGKPIPEEATQKRDLLRKLLVLAKTDFEEQQKLVMELQDLKTERQTLARRFAELQRESPATRPTMRSDLKTLLATGAVHCEMTDTAKKSQTIDCNRLSMLTAMGPDGKPYPSVINADGEVHAVDPEQDLRAGHMAVTLRPSTRPATRPAKDRGGAETGVELQSLIAHNNVKVISKDGAVASADQLLIDNKDGRNLLKLLGQPQASIVDKKNTISGPIIEIDPEAQRLDVVGSGKMKGVQQEKADQPPRPIDVAWTRSLSFDGKSNLVDVVGDVTALSKDADGTANTAKGQRVRMLLADAAPATRPSTKPATQAATQPATKPAKASQYGALSSKTVRQIVFNDDAEVSSVLLDDKGLVLRRTHLLAQKIDYDMVAKKLVIPVEGKMVVEDHRPGATTKPAGADPQDNRGTTAFQWTKRFTYDDATHLAVMEGDAEKQVLIVHREDAANPRTFRLNGDVVTAELEAMPATPEKAKPAAGQPAAAKEKQDRMQMKRVTAKGHLHFSGPGAEIYAWEMIFDPQTHWLIARGDGNNPVDFDIQSTIGGRQNADEVQYNTETGMSKAVNARVRVVR